MAVILKNNGSLLCPPHIILPQGGSVSGGALVVLLLKTSQKVGEGAEAALVADLGDGIVGGEEEIFGVFETETGDILCQRRGGHGVEELADVMWREGTVGGDIGQRDVLTEVVVDVEKDLLHLRTGVAVAFREGGRVLRCLAIFLEGKKHGFDDTGADGFGLAAVGHAVVEG